MPYPAIPEAMPPRTRARFWIMILILLLGASLRLCLIHVHGIDGDEAFSLDLARYPLRDLLDSFASDELDLHPKLYYVLLHFWMQATGASVIGARLLGVLCDLMLGAALQHTTRRLFGTRPALAAGLLWSLNPLLIWVTAQVRMYALLALLATLTWLCLLRALDSRRPAWWIVFGITALGVAYTQIVGAAALAAAGAAAGGWLLARRRIGGVVALGGVGLAYVPYALTMWARRGDHPLLAENPPDGVPDFVRRFVSMLLVHHPPWSDGWLWVLALLCLGLLAWGLIRTRQRAAGPLVATVGLMLVTAAAGAAYFVFGSDVFRTKYFAFVAPLFLVGLALGVEQLPGRWARGAALITLAGASLLGLAEQLAPANRDDFRSAAHFVTEHSDSGDLIIVTSNYGEKPFRAYYDGPARVIGPWYGISPDLPLDDLLIHITAGYDTVWLVSYMGNAVDPDDLLNRWFAARYPLRTEIFPAGVTTRAYDLRPQTADLPPEAIPLDVTFGGQAALRGYQVYTGSVPRRDHRLHPPSSWVHVTLYWETLAPGVSFRPDVRLEGETGAVWGGILDRPNDTLDRFPPETWTPGQVWRTDFDLILNPDADPGRYKIVVRVANPDGGFWLLDGLGVDWLILDRVRVTRW